MTEAPPIRFATTSDGVRIAYADSGGDGPPLIWTPSWVSHIEADWGNEDIRSLFERLQVNHRFIHFDGRGTGLSDRDVEELSSEARARDIEAVVDSLGLGSFDLFAWSQWGPPAIIYAAGHGEKVRRLALYATYAKFHSEGSELANALLALIRAEWSVGSRTITEFVYPNIDHEHERVFVSYFRRSASARVAAAILEEGFFHADVTEQLSGLTMPTTVLHRDDDTAVESSAGREIASLVRGARFVPLAGDIHVPWHGDVDAFLEALEASLGVASAPPSSTPAARPRRRGTLVTLLFTDIEGSTAFTDHLGDAAAQDLVRAHNTIVREALEAYGGTEVKHTGDGIMASFSSASGAVESAIAIQRALAERSRQQAEMPLQVRIGLNAGEPVAEDDPEGRVDLFGSAVQVARRICDRAEPGEILVSNVVRELAAGKGFLFADRGEMALRGFEDPIHVYDVRWAE